MELVGEIKPLFEPKENRIPKDDTYKPILPNEKLEQVQDNKNDLLKKKRRNTLEFIRVFIKEHRKPTFTEKKSADENVTEPFKIKKQIRLTENTAAIFLIGTALGGFAFELPHALKQSGFAGVFLVILCGINSLYSGMLLGWCWIIMEERWPEYKQDFRSPYAEIGNKVGGRWLKYIVTLIVIVNQLGFGVILLWYMSKFIDRMSSLHFCPMLIICTFALMPFIFHKSPKNFRYLGVLSFLSSCLAVALISIAAILDKSRVSTVTYPKTTFESVSSSFGVMVLAFNAGAIYPTIQIDMYDRKKFPNSVFTSFLVILLMFLTFPVLSYASYGKGTDHDVIDNILENKSLISVGHLAQLFFVIQMGSTLVLQMNPAFQICEEYLNISPHFSYKGCFIRILLMIVILMLSMASKYLVEFMLYIQTTITNLITYIMPCIFYVVLVYRKGDIEEDRKITKKEWFFLAELLVIGIVGMVATYYMGYHKLVEMKRFEVNCFDPYQFAHTNFSYKQQHH